VRGREGGEAGRGGGGEEEGKKGRGEGVARIFRGQLIVVYVCACVVCVCVCVQLYCCICTSVFFVSSAIDSFAETILTSLGSSATLPVHFKITSLVRLILFTLPIVAQTLLAFVINLYPPGKSLSKFPECDRCDLYILPQRIPTVA